MSEINLSALAETDKDATEAKTQTPMQDINSALKACGFGRFHIRLLCTALIAIVSNVQVSSSTAYLLSSAECDLNMTLIQKGLLNAVPYGGMIISSVVAGFLTDTFGRKIFLLIGYGGICLCMLIGGSSQTYEVLVTAKFFEGILFATSFSPTVTLTAEFCHSGVRDRVVLGQSSLLAVAQVIIAAITWGLLTRDWKYTFFDGYFVLNTWNFYLYIMALWPLTACILYAFLPESPKYLVTQKKYDEAREILIAVYKENTGKPAETFQYVDLWKNKAQGVIDEKKNKANSSLSHQLVVGLHNVKPMFKKPLRYYLILVCIMTFLSMMLYNVCRLWFPQVSTIVEHYRNSEDDQSLCVMLDAYISDLKQRSANVTNADVCVPAKSGAETYINSIILGCVCIVPYLIGGVLVNRVGKKCLLIVSSIVCFSLTLGLRWAVSKALVVTLFSLDTAVSQIMISMYQAFVIEFFPTATRALAVSLMMVNGRIGTLVGNLMFPILLNISCSVPFISLSVVMMSVTLMTMILPNKKN